MIFNNWYVDQGLDSLKQLMYVLFSKLTQCECKITCSQAFEKIIYMQIPFHCIYLISDPQIIKLINCNHVQIGDKNNLIVTKEADAIIKAGMY